MIDLQAVDEIAISGLVVSGGGIDADCPKPAEGSLTITPVAISVLHGLGDGLLTDPVAATSRLDHPLGSTSDFQAFEMRYLSASSAHGYLPNDLLRFRLEEPVN